MNGLKGSQWGCAPTVTFTLAVYFEICLTVLLWNSLTHFLIFFQKLLAKYDLDGKQKSYGNRVMMISDHPQGAPKYSPNRPNHAAFWHDYTLAPNIWSNFLYQATV
jgi:hypothetical protein